MYEENPKQQYRSKLKEKLQALGLDACYTRGEGDILFQKTKSGEAKILDLVGGYGANFLGHSHGRLTASITDFLQKQTPVFTQGSICSSVQDLNQRLQELFGNYRVILTNTGAETVETAVKHAILENGKSRCWALTNAYHGKSLGTLSFSKVHNAPFKRNDLQVDFLDPNNPASWEAALASIEEVSFAIVEPIRGEAGVIPLPPAFVTWINEVTAAYNIPLIVDEIQTGLGRTGSLLAADQIGLRKDYLCLSKALGGGMAKIGALLVAEKRYIEEFSVINTTTFSDDGLSATIAKAALDTIVAGDLPRQCADKGALLKAELLKIKGDYPSVIKEVRGKGLMIGVDFQTQQNSSSNLLRILFDSGYYGYVIAGHLLHEYGIRIMPTLSNPNTLRVQPSAYISTEHIYQFLNGLRTVSEMISKADAGSLLSYLVGRSAEKITDYQDFDVFEHQAPEGHRKVAFLGHFIKAKDLILWDQSFENWSEKELEKLISRTARFLEPVIFDQVNVKARGGRTVHLNFIGLFLDSREIGNAYRSGDFQWIVDKIQHAANIAEENGCQVLGLGGFTSILTRNARWVKTKKMKVTTGNSLTVGFGLKAIYEAAKQKGVILEDSSVAIVGAGGNIANTYAELLASQVEEMILIPRVLDSPKIVALQEQLLLLNPGLRITITDQMEAIKHCPIVVTSSNSIQPIILPEHLSIDSKIICDLAVPADVDKNVGLIYPDLKQIMGGIVRLPEPNRFIVGGIPLPSGHIFACMGETIVMGLDECTHFTGSVGAVQPDDVHLTLGLADKFGYQLGLFKEERSY
ncbi:MAG: aminotransferase class III-fold pyridoxal phosphate-dependent enzyme [Saprospiraceae bacterium]|nr:aminotransferase class III-fold pyridoxal phosphate-dependent enzyme [Saprospiraceae bacterium]